MSASLRTQLDGLNAAWLSLMRAGRFAEAWEVSDLARETRTPIDCTQWPRHRQFIWQGGSLAGRRVLVRCYHGLGDTLQFVRFVPELRGITRELILWAQPELLPLLQQVKCADSLLPLHDGVPDVHYEVDVELSELMHVLRVTPEEVGKNVPYLHAAAVARTAENRERLREDPTIELRRDGVMHVGLVWASGSWDSHRSIPPELLAPLGAIPGVKWHLLQRGPALKGWCNGFGTAPVLRDIVDEARAMLRMDLIITVDTCSAHLAGGLGVNVWTLLHHDPDWRWMLARADTPWYPSMRLFRQPRPGAWRPVIAEVRRRVRAWTQRRPRLRRAQAAGDSLASSWMASR